MSGQRIRGGIVPFVVVCGLGLSRILRSIDQVPPDPSVDFYVEAHFDAWTTLFRTEGGYLDVPRRIFALIISLLPPELWALASNAIWILIMGFSAVLMAQAARYKSLGFIPTAFFAVALVLAPSASESQVGHESIIKWPLLLLSAVTWSIRPSIHELRKMDLAILAITGFSNPMYPLLLGAILASTRWVRTSGAKTSQIKAVLLVIPAIAQIVAWGLSRQPLQKYGDSAIRLPWDGMGGFWWINWLWSPATTVIVLMHAFLCRKRNDRTLWIRVRLATFGFVLWASCYYIGGIGDRYFVVPQVLGSLAAVMMIHTPTQHQGHRNLQGLASLAGLGVLALFLAASYQWFGSSAFLSSSDRWSESARRARNECQSLSSNVVLIPQSMNTIELPCLVLNHEK